jgi:hypothetical protein
MDVQPGRLEVRGNYHLVSAAADPLVAVLFYPFPLDSTCTYPDSVEVVGHDFTRSDSGISFRMRFRPGAEDSFFACYRQPLKGRVARYIVTSTRKWNRPIDLAQFRITVPAAFEDVKLSYRPDSVRRTGSAVTYIFSRRGFFPDRDVIVNWR